LLPPLQLWHGEFDDDKLNIVASAGCAAPEAIPQHGKGRTQEDKVRG
jgi:hypothetical protein